jgi:hypothetical protein
VSREQVRATDGACRSKSQCLNFNPTEGSDAHESHCVLMFVELRAPNYPGSTYTLVYDPKQDQLRGIYYQGALGQSFDVYFVRME